MIKKPLNPAPRSYRIPVCELLGAAPEELFCVSGNGTIEDVAEEEWGNC